MPPIEQIDMFFMRAVSRISFVINWREIHRDEVIVNWHCTCGAAKHDACKRGLRPHSHASHFGTCKSGGLCEKASIGDVTGFLGSVSAL